MSKIKNIIIYAVIAIALVLIYIFFIKPAPTEQNLVSSPSVSNGVAQDTGTIDKNSLIAKDLLSVLLSVKSIKLDDTIFSNTAFINLRDSSITLTSPTDEGRLNPFAPIGSDITVPPVVPPVVSPSTPTPAPVKTPSKNVKTP